MGKSEELEQWQEIADYWHLIEAELQRLEAQCYQALASATHTTDMSEVRELQGRLSAYKAVGAIPRRKVDELVRQRKEEIHG